MLRETAGRVGNIVVKRRGEECLGRTSTSGFSPDQALSSFLRYPALSLPPRARLSVGRRFATDGALPAERRKRGNRARSTENSRLAPRDRTSETHFREDKGGRDRRSCPRERDFEAKRRRGVLDE